LTPPARITSMQLSPTQRNDNSATPRCLHQTFMPHAMNG